MSPKFYGIAIYMYYNDHAPPHFHAEYGEDEGQFTIETLELLVGQLPRRSKSLVLEWASMYRDDLRKNWELARDGLPLKWIPPLDQLETRVSLMRSMDRVKQVTPLSGFVVRLSFTDDTQRDVDLEPFLHGPVFEPLQRDRDEFLKVSVDSRAGTIVWPNGADIDPDVLYLGLQPAWRESPQLASPATA